MKSKQTYTILIMLLFTLLCPGVLSAQPLEVVFEDDFSDNRHEWSESDGEKNSLRIADGYYWFNHKVEEGAWLTWKEIDIAEHNDFLISTTIKKISGVDNYGYGLLWGLKDVDHYYQFALSGNGHYRCIKVDGDESTTIIKWTQSEAIMQGDGAVNTITVRQEGQGLKFLINDQQVAEAEAEPFFGNQVGYIVYNILQVAIDDLRVEQPASHPPSVEKQPRNIVPKTPTPAPVESTQPLEIQPETVSASRVALVIGNNAYGSIPLTTPLNDAHALAQVLETLGFYVLHATNLTLSDMQSTIASFAELLPGKEMAVFYFSGYAVQRRGTNYLLPVGNRIRSEGHLLYEAISVTELITTFQQAGTLPTLLLLDACRETPDLWVFEKGLAAMSAPADFAIAYNAAPGTLVDDSEAPISTFARRLQSLLQQGEITGKQMFEALKAEVTVETEGQQTPWFSYNIQTP